MPDSPPTKISTAQRRGNQFKLLVLWLVPFGLMAIAGLCYYLVQTGQMQIGSKNHGVLLQPPLQLHEVLQNMHPLDQVTGGVVPASPWRGKWSMVVRADAGCDEACRDNLYTTRQLHIRLDKQANRVQRIYLSAATDTSDAANNSDELTEFLQREHHLLKRYQASAVSLAELDAALQSGNGERARFFIVDPAGWAMMYYLEEHGGNDILQDFKHLLKYSKQR